MFTFFPQLQDWIFTFIPLLISLQLQTSLLKLSICFIMRVWIGDCFKYCVDLCVRLTGLAQTSSAYTIAELLTLTLVSFKTFCISRSLKLLIKCWTARSCWVFNGQAKNARWDSYYISAADSCNFHLVTELRILIGYSYIFSALFSKALTY